MKLKQWTRREPWRIADFNEALASVDKELSDRGYNLKWFGVKENDSASETYAKITQALAFVPEGATVLLPEGIYNINADIQITRRVTLMGSGRPFFDGLNLVGGTVIKGGGFRLAGVNNVVIKDLGVQTPDANGFNVRGVSSDNLIENCAAAARDHGWLVEEYDGIIQRARVRNCYAFKGIHGFVSKSRNGVFENCHAFDNTSNGFVISSDNNPLATRKAYSHGSKAINCTANGCTVGYTVHARDFHSSSNANGLALENVSLENCYALNCRVGYNFGNPDPAQGLNRVELAPKYVRVKNCFESGSLDVAVRAYKLQYSEIDIQVTSDKPVIWTEDRCIQVSLGVNKPTTYYSKETLSVNSATPNVSSGRKYYKTFNTATTIITNFVGGQAGQEIEVAIMDDVTSILSGANITMFRAEIKGRGSTVKFYFDGNTWNEVTGTSTGKATNQNIKNNGNLDLTRGNVWDLHGDGGTTQPIVFNNKNVESQLITLVIRSSVDGSPITFSFGSDVMRPNGFPTTATYTQRVVATFVYIDNIAKWCNVSWQYVNP